MEELTIDEEMIKKRLDNLNVCKSVGPNGVHPRLLKELSNHLCKPLPRLFNYSLAVGELSRTLLKCENICLLTLLGNCSLICRTNYSFRSCDPPNVLLISRVLSLIRSFSAFLITSLAFLFFMPHFMFKLVLPPHPGVTPSSWCYPLILVLPPHPGVTPSSRHRKDGFYVARFYFPATQMSRIFRTVFCPYCRLIFVKMFIKLVYTYEL